MQVLQLLEFCALPVSAKPPFSRYMHFIGLFRFLSSCGFMPVGWNCRLKGWVGGGDASKETFQLRVRGGVLRWNLEVCQAVWPDSSNIGDQH